MIDIDKTKTAKEWILQLANGINPLDGKQLNDSDIVNDVHISRCLFYVAEVLDSTTRSKSRPEKQYTSEFYLSEENAKLIVFYESTGINNLTVAINKVLPEGMHPINSTQILKWLINEGYLSEVILEDGKKSKEATSKGNELGLHTSWQISTSGTKYLATSYNIDAQKFIVANVNNMVK